MHKHLYMYIGMCIGMGIDVRIDMCTDMCIDTPMHELAGARPGGCVFRRADEFLIITYELLRAISHCHNFLCQGGYLRPYYNT